MIRPAVEEDLQAIYGMAQDFADRVFHESARDRGRVQETINKAFESGVILVDNDVRGMLVLLFIDHLWVKEVAAAELVWYVSPEARGDGLGVSLLNEAIKISKEAGAETLSMMYVEKSMPNVVKSIYEEMGFSLGETAYTIRL